MRVVQVWSKTHYGRGTPKTHQEVRIGIQDCLDHLELVAPNLPVYGHADEDYGWIVPVSEEQEAEIRARFPLSHEEHNIVYIHDGKSKFGDAMLAKSGTDRIVTIVTLDKAYEDHLQGCGPVERTYDALYEDWYDNYGKY